MRDRLHGLQLLAAVCLAVAIVAATRLFPAHTISTPAASSWDRIERLAFLATTTPDRDEHVRTLARIADSNAPDSAAAAMLTLAQLDPAHGYALDWTAAPPRVAAAMLYAATLTDPDDPRPAIAALRSPHASPQVRAAAAYALSLSDAPPAHAALLEIADTPPESITSLNQLTVWRAVLALPRPDLRRMPPTPLEEVFAMWTLDDGLNPLVTPIALAATHHQGIAGGRRPGEDHWWYDEQLELATIEGQEPDVMRWPLTGYKSPLQRAVTVAITLDPHIGDLRPAFLSPEATLRELAAVVAVERFPRERVAGMIGSLLEDGGGEARHSAWLLARLINDPRDIRIDSVPRTTRWVLALHRGELVRMLDELFSDSSRLRPDPLDLLVRRRWWHVLSRYLPEDAPPLWLWGDVGVQRFQLDVLRAWLAANRSRLVGVVAEE